MVRVLIDARMISYSGIGRYLSNVLPVILESSAYEFHFLAFSEDTARHSYLSNSVHTPVTARIYSVQEQLDFVKYVRNCDLFWSPHFNAPLLPIRAKKRVVTIHDVYHLAYANQLPMAKRWYARALIANAVKKSDKIITVSNFSKSEILKYTDTTDSKVSVIHNGLDLSFFEEEISLKKLSKDNTFSFLNGSFFLYVGNFKKHKNVELILQAYLLWLSQYGSAVKVILVGKEFQGCSIRKYVNINPLLQSNVIFIDDASDSDLQWLYQNALALIMPSLYEGFGFTPLEAMASNCPAIVSDAASLPEVCGDAAYYIDPKSAEQLFLAMKHVAFDAEYRGELIEKGKRKAAEYSWKKAAEEHIKVFDSLILE